jgi:hypothetical protein
MTARMVHVVTNLTPPASDEPWCTAAPPADVAALSVVCEMMDPFGLMGEKTLTEPTGVERRKGYDMAKGRAPAPIDNKLIDDLIAAL